MALPLIGAIGNVSKKALMRHIAKPVLPTTVKPAMRRILKNPANASDMKTEAHDSMAPMRFVNFAP